MATSASGKSKTKRSAGKTGQKPATKRPATAASKAPVKDAAQKTAVRKPAAKPAVVNKVVGKAADKTATKAPGAKQASTGKATKKPAEPADSKKAKPTPGATGKKASPTKAVSPPSAVVKNDTDRASKKTPSHSITGNRAAHKITPEQALANTRALLEAKKEHNRQPQPWQKLDHQAGPVDHAGYQSPEAADKAEQLHEGESRVQAIQGSISSIDHRNQGKRDKR